MAQVGFPRIPKRIITDIVFFAEHDRLKVTKVTPGYKFNFRAKTCTEHYKIDSYNW